MPDLSGHKTFKSDSSREVPNALCSARAVAGTARSRHRARRAAHQHRAPRLPRRDGVSTGAGGPHDLRVKAARHAVDLRRPASGRQLQADRRRPLRPGDGHVRAGRVQRRRHRSRRGRLRAALAGDGLRRVPRPRGGAAARPDLPAVAQRQRRAVDAAGRDAEPERRAGRVARPVGLRPVVLAGAHGLGARRGPSCLQARRPRLRALPGRADGPRDQRTRARRVVQVRPVGRSSTASACRRG